MNPFGSSKFLLQFEMTFRPSETSIIFNLFGSSKTILPFENTAGSDKTARNYPEIAKAGTPDQPDLSSQTDSSDPPNS